MTRHQFQTIQMNTAQATGINSRHPVRSTSSAYVWNFGSESGAGNDLEWWRAFSDATLRQWTTSQGLIQVRVRRWASFRRCYWPRCPCARWIERRARPAMIAICMPTAQSGWTSAHVLPLLL